MSRRTRALGFAAAAALCAGLAAAAAGGARSDLASQLGPLQEVVVASAPLPAQRAISARAAGRALELRRIPERFVPPGALGAPAQAVGRAPAVPIAAGGYLLASELRAARASDRRPEPRLGGDRRPVEIAVHGGEPLAGSTGGSRTLVDVVVTTEAGPGGGPGRTYVAAEAVALLDLRPAGPAGADSVLGGPSDDQWLATLALTREEALALIHAQSFARDLRLIAR